MKWIVPEINRETAANTETSYQMPPAEVQLATEPVALAAYEPDPEVVPEATLAEAEEYEIYTIDASDMLSKYFKEIQRNTFANMGDKRKFRSCG